MGPVGKIANPTARDLAIGAASDLVSTESQDANATQQIVDAQLLKRIPWIDEILLGAPRGTLQEIFDDGIAPILGTKDSDHPWLKTLKNAVEGIGLDMLVSKVLSRLDPVEDVARKQNITDQVDEAAAYEVAEDMAARDAFARAEAIRASRPQLPGEAIDVDVVPERQGLPGTAPEVPDAPEAQESPGHCHLPVSLVTVSVDTKTKTLPILGKVLPHQLSRLTTLDAKLSFLDGPGRHLELDRLTLSSPANNLRSCPTLLTCPRKNSGKLSKISPLISDMQT